MVANPCARLWPVFLLLFLSLPLHARVHYKHVPRRKVLHVETRIFLGHGAQLRQNKAIDAAGLPRYKNDRELKVAEKSGELEEIISSDGLVLDKRLPIDRRYCRPDTLLFLYEMSSNFYLRFHEPVILTSAVRTVQVQRRLERWNHNAAPAHGELGSSHLAGTTFDIARGKMTFTQILWVQAYLKRAGDAVIVIEEVREPCFHIMVVPIVGAPNGID